MGNCGGSGATPEEIERRKKEKQIEAKMEQDDKIEKEKIKLLLLGAGESGKSTIFKQMKVIYGEQYTEAERKQAIPVIFSNIIQAMKILCDQAVTFSMEGDIKNKQEFEMIRKMDECEPLSVSSGSAISTLWADPGILAVWDRRNEFQIIESVQYYFNKINEIKMPDWLPDKDDILYSRVRTSGIVTERYIMEGTTFEMYDVGGQRNERKKWIYCFEGVTAVIFVAAISEYDQKLFEDASANRMVSYQEPTVLAMYRNGFVQVHA
jgi:GTPase SAR1 family protein